MKKQSLLLLLVAVAGAAIISLAQGTPGEKPAAANQELAEMRKQINELRASVRSLEGRMKGLESTVDELARPDPKRPHLQPLASPGENSLWFNSPTSGPKPPASDSTRPKIWGEREINGWTFYVIPCGEPGHIQDESHIGMPSSR